MHVLSGFTLQLLLVFLQIVCPCWVLGTGSKNLRGDRRTSNVITTSLDACAAAHAVPDKVLSQNHGFVYFAQVATRLRGRAVKSLFRYCVIR
jgi:hypothetical protein